MRHSEIEKILCYTQNCIHINKNDKICNLNGMTLETLSPNFKCGNLNNPSAKKTYLPKPEDLDISFDLIRIGDKVFQDALKIITDELKRIFSNIEDLKLKKALSSLKTPSKDHNIIFEPKFFHQFGQLDDIFLAKKADILSLLRKLLPFAKDNIEFWLPFDSRLYFISIGDIYDCLIENAMEKYLTHPDKFQNNLLNLINNWRETFKSKIFSYELIIPLKGLFFSDLNWNELTGKRVDDEEVQKYMHETTFHGWELKNYIINLNKTSKHSSIQLNPPPIYSIFKTQKQNSVKFNSCYISTKLFCPITFRGYVKAPNIRDSKPWQYIKEINQTFLVSGIKLRLGKPFYKFPWWISKILVNEISFAIPEWMDESNMWINPIEPLIPDFFAINIGFDLEIDKLRSYDGDVFLGKSEVLKKGVLVKGGSLPMFPLSKLSEIKSIYSILTDPNSININFNNSQIKFLLNNLLRLVKRNSLEDAILDACLILESIGSSEKSKKYLIIASILADTTNRFANFFKMQYNLYNCLDKARNKIIHGSSEWTKEYLDLAKTLIYTKDLNDDEILKKKNLVQERLYDKIAEILKKIIIKNINLKELGKKDNFINILPIN